VFGLKAPAVRGVASTRAHDVSVLLLEFARRAEVGAEPEADIIHRRVEGGSWNQQPCCVK